MLTAVCVGASLGPDIDHPNATVTRSTGLLLHETARGMSAAARKATSTSRDQFAFRKAASRGMDPDHRALTHTAVFGVGVSGFVFVLAQVPFGGAAVAAACVLAGRTLLRDKWRFALLGAALAVLLAGHDVLHDPQQVALAFLGGWISHLLADGCTTAGVPMLWPVKVRGRRWWRVRILGSWLRSGESKEVVAAIGVAAFLNIPYLMNR